MVTYITLSLEYIFNNCVMCSDALKTAKVVLICKRGAKSLPTNYRPISLISNLVKIFETIIHRRIDNFAIECEVISPNKMASLKTKVLKMRYHM